MKINEQHELIKVLQDQLFSLRKAEIDKIVGPEKPEQRKRQRSIRINEQDKIKEQEKIVSHEKPWEKKVDAGKDIQCPNCNNAYKYMGKTPNNYNAFQIENTMTIFTKTNKCVCYYCNVIFCIQ